MHIGLKNELIKHGIVGYFNLSYISVGKIDPDFSRLLVLGRIRLKVITTQNSTWNHILLREAIQTFIDIQTF